MDIDLRKAALTLAGWKAGQETEYGLLWELRSPSGRGWRNGRDYWYSEEQVWENAPAVEDDIQLALRFLPISPLIVVRIDYHTLGPTIQFVQRAVYTEGGGIKAIPDRSICHGYPPIEALAAKYCQLWMFYKDQESKIEAINHHI